MAELWPRAEDRGPAAGQHRRLPASIGAGPGIRRGLVEPRQPEDLPLHAGGPGGDAVASWRGRPRDEDRLHLHFALGKALEDCGDYAASFEHYARGQCAAPRRASLRRGRNDDTQSAASRGVYARVLRLRAGWGADAPTRSSSSACRARVRRCSSRSSPATRRSKAPWSCRRSSRMAESCGGGPKRSDIAAYAEVLAKSSAAELRELGEQYLERTRIQRKTAAPFFIDKMPNNLLHVGLIHADPAEGEDHRRPPASAGLLLLELQAALRPRPELQLQPDRHGPLLPRLRGADGALR